MTVPRFLAAGIGIAAIGTAAFFVRESTTDSRRRGVYAFDLYEEGRRLHLLLADYADGADSPELRYTRSDDGGSTWTESVRVDEGASPAFVPYRGVDPQIAASGDAFVAAWTTAGDDVYGYGTGPLATAFSRDGGKTWRPGPDPADDGLTTAHEFLDVAADAEGTFHLIWIDDRDDEDGLRRGLRYTRSTDAGESWSANGTIDEHICGCCWTHLRTDAAGRLLALYRDEDPAPSDMRLAVSENAGDRWSDVATVGAFGWMQRGCPHTTAGLAFRHAPELPALHALVQTGKEGLEGVYHLASVDGGRSWSEPAKIAGEGAHYADLAASGELLGGVWQGQLGTRTVVYGRLSRDGGATWSEPELLTDPGVSAGYPRIASDGGSFRVFWIQSPDGSHHSWLSVPWAAPALIRSAERAWDRSATPSARE